MGNKDETKSPKAKWLLFALCLTLMLAGGVVTDLYFRPGKSNDRNSSNPTTYTGIALFLDALIAGAWAVAEYNKKKE